MGRRKQGREGDLGIVDRSEHRSQEVLASIVQYARSRLQASSVLVALRHALCNIEQAFKPAFHEQIAGQ